MAEKHKHVYEKLTTPECTEPWQFQFVCSCGKLKDKYIYGRPPIASPVEQVKALPTLPNDDVSVENPADIQRIVQVLFDNNLDWTAAVKNFYPLMPPKEAFKLGLEWQADERVQKGVDAYVKSLQASPVRFAQLVHISGKIASDTGASSAVRSTAMNVLKSAYVVEKSEQQGGTVIVIKGDGVMEDIAAGIAGDKVEVIKESEIVN